MKMFLFEYIVERSCLDSWVFKLNEGLLHLILTCHGNHISGYEFDGPWYLLNMARQCASVSDKMAFVLHDAQCRDQKRDHWFIDHHNDIMVPVETFWRWTFFDGNLQELLLQSPPDILDHPCCMNGWFRFLNHFQHQQLEGPLTRRWATSRRVSAPPGGDTTGENDVGFTFDVSMWKGIREDVWLEICYCYRN